MFRFTIRELLLVTVIVAFAVLWWGEYRLREPRTFGDRRGR